LSDQILELTGSLDSNGIYSEKWERLAYQMPDARHSFVAMSLNTANFFETHEQNVIDRKLVTPKNPKTYQKYCNNQATIKAEFCPKPHLLLVSGTKVLDYTKNKGRLEFSGINYPKWPQDAITASSVYTPPVVSTKSFGFKWNDYFIIANGELWVYFYQTLEISFIF
jgi:hypothetical protein